MMDIIGYKTRRIQEWITQNAYIAHGKMIMSYIKWQSKLSALLAILEY